MSDLEFDGDAIRRIRDADRWTGEGPRSWEWARRLLRGLDWSVFASPGPPERQKVKDA